MSSYGNSKIGIPVGIATVVLPLEAAPLARLFPYISSMASSANILKKASKLRPIISGEVDIPSSFSTSISAFLSYGKSYYLTSTYTSCRSSTVYMTFIRKSMKEMLIIVRYIFISDLSHCITPKS